LFTEYLENSEYKTSKIRSKESKLVEDLENKDSEFVLNRLKLSSYELIKNLFDSIFSSKYNDYTFYTQNLGGFDYIFILSALSYYNNEYLLVPLIKEDNNLLVYLKISNFGAAAGCWYQSCGQPASNNTNTNRKRSCYQK
jgi:hypothetical protein